jgi:indolepyruvate ferredoxin oxidoreductase alpha subunit
LIKAIGVEKVEAVDTWDRKEVGRAIQRALAHKGPSVVIAVGACQQLPEMKHRELIPYFVDESLCTQCEACFKVWCPAITRTALNFPVINPDECTACTVCAQVCPVDAIYLWKAETASPLPV